jgi:peptide deformylase
VTEVEGQIRDEQLDAEREARRQIALVQVRQYPDPVLRMKANEVEAFDDPLGALVTRMSSLMDEARGVGLAAPQIGVLQRLIVYQADEDEPVRALVNPRIVESSETLETGDEGCLSLGAATVVVPVERPDTVVIEAMSPEREELRIEADGLTARVLQHELDHLDGILIIDRAGPDDRKEALAKLRPQPVLERLGPLH